MEVLSQLLESVFGVSSKKQKGGSGLNGLLGALEDSLPSENVRSKRPRRAKIRAHRKQMEERQRKEQKKKERMARAKEKREKRLERERKFAPLWAKYEALLGKSPPQNKYKYDEEWLKRKIADGETDKALSDALKKQHLSFTPTIFDF